MQDCGSYLQDSCMQMFTTILQHFAWFRRDGLAFDGTITNSQAFAHFSGPVVAHMAAARKLAIRLRWAKRTNKGLSRVRSHQEQLTCGRRRRKLIRRWPRR